MMVLMMTMKMRQTAMTTENLHCIHPSMRLAHFGLCAIQS
jgi:hypothetical protein